MVLNKDEFLASLKDKIGEDTSDESLKFLEDMTDTYDSLSKKAGGEDWEAKYNELDKSWRDKYKARFFESSADSHDADLETLYDGEGDNSPKKFTDLFEEKEK